MCPSSGESPLYSSCNISKVILQTTKMFHNQGKTLHYSILHCEYCKPCYLISCMRLISWFLTLWSRFPLLRVMRYWGRRWRALTCKQSEMILRMCPSSGESPLYSSCNISKVILQTTKMFHNQGKTLHYSILHCEYCKPCYLISCMRLISWFLTLWSRFPLLRVMRYWGRRWRALTCKQSLMIFRMCPSSGESLLFSSCYTFRGHCADY